MSGKSRRPSRAPQGPSSAPHAPSDADSSTLLGNAAMSALVARQHGEAPSDLPYLSQMEDAFGEDFSDVQVESGRRGELGELGAEAAASGDTVTFADPNPDPETVAHELAHVVQARRSGRASAPALRDAETSAPQDDSEREAARVGARVAAGGDAGPIAAAPSAPVQRKEKGRPAKDYYEGYVLRVLELGLTPATFPLDDRDDKSPAQLLRALFAVPEVCAQPDVALLRDRYKGSGSWGLDEETLQEASAYARAQMATPQGKSYEARKGLWEHSSARLIAKLDAGEAIWRAPANLAVVFLKYESRILAALKAGRVLARGDGAERFSKLSLYLGHESTVPRRDTCRHVAGDALYKAVTEAVAEGRTVTLHLWYASPEEARAARRVASRVERIELSGLSVRPEEYLQLYEYFSWGRTPAVCLQLGRAQGASYASNSPSGRRNRQERAEQTLDLGEIEHSNAVAGGSLGALSTVGSASRAEVAEMLAILRAGGGKAGVLQAEAEKRHSPSSVKLDTAHEDFKGISLTEGANKLFKKMRHVDETLTELFEQGKRVDEERRELAKLEAREITARSFEQVLNELDRLMWRVEREHRIILNRFGVSRAENQKVVAKNIGEMKDGDEFCSVLGKLAESLVPNVGSKGKLQAIGRVPVPWLSAGNSGVFLGVEFIGTVERDDKGLKVRLQGGFTIVGQVDAELVRVFAEARGFGYLEGYGDSGTEVFDLIWLAFYDLIRNRNADAAKALMSERDAAEVKGRMDKDDYADRAVGYSVAAGVALKKEGPSAISGVAGSVGGTTGTRLARGKSGDVEAKEMDVFEMAGKLAAGDYSFETKLVAKQIGDQSSGELEASADLMLDVTTLTDNEMFGTHVASALGLLAHGAVGWLGAMSDDRARAWAARLDGLHRISGADLIARRKVSELLKDRYRKKFAGVKVGHKLTVKLAMKPDGSLELEVVVERVNTIEFGDNPQAKVYILLENVDTLVKVNLPLAGPRGKKPDGRS